MVVYDPQARTGFRMAVKTRSNVSRGPEAIIRDVITYPIFAADAIPIGPLVFKALNTFSHAMETNTVSRIRLSLLSFCKFSSICGANVYTATSIALLPCHTAENPLLVSANERSGSKHENTLDMHEWMLPRV
jgi:hypothetical protein